MITKEKFVGKNDEEVSSTKSTPDFQQSTEALSSGQQQSSNKAGKSMRGIRVLWARNRYSLILKMANRRRKLVRLPDFASHELESSVGTMSTSRISFGDKVRIRSATATDAIGAVGQTGIVYGHTTPSVTGVEVIGDTPDDYAVAVMIEGRAESLWFAEALLELVDRQPGTTIEIAGRRLIRDERGEWHDPKPRQ